MAQFMSPFLIFTQRYDSFSCMFCFFSICLCICTVSCVNHLFLLWIYLNNGDPVSGHMNLNFKKVREAQTSWAAPIKPNCQRKKRKQVVQWCKLNLTASLYLWRVGGLEKWARHDETNRSKDSCFFSPHICLKLHHVFDLCAKNSTFLQHLCLKISPQSSLHLVRKVVNRCGGVFSGYQAGEIPSRR